MSFIPRQIIGDLSLKFQKAPLHHVDNHARLAVRQAQGAVLSKRLDIYQRVENEFSQHPVRATATITALTLFGVLGGTWYEKAHVRNPLLNIMSEEDLIQYSDSVNQNMIGLTVTMGCLYALGLLYAGYQVFTKKAEDKK